jgi:DNA repair protein RadA/Sms
MLVAEGEKADRWKLSNHMPKAHSKFVCQQCGGESAKWLGRCPECGEWNTLVEVPDLPRGAVESAVPRPVMAGTPLALPDIATAAYERYSTGLAEVDRVLGGGLVPGSLVLVGGEPGIGKSTLLLQVSSLIAERQGPTLYISAEESAEQVKMRAERLDIIGKRLHLLTETDIDVISASITGMRPCCVVIDSIQTIASLQLASAPGSVSQVRECTLRLMHVAKDNHIPIFLIGHVTKEGTVAGPRVLEHIVDAVLYLEGERYHTYRLLRGVKNRFGPTNEVGVFEMQGEGLVEVANPSALFLTERGMQTSGSAVVVSMEGTRPLLVEVQALVTPTNFGLPRCTTTGIDHNRLLMLLAVLSKRVGLALGNQDVYANVVGGFTLDEPAVDLGIAVAIASSFRDRPLDPHVALIGEVGLSGELRAVSRAGLRVREAAKLGFRRCIMPAAGADLALITGDGFVVAHSGKRTSDGRSRDTGGAPVSAPALPQVELIRVQSLAEALQVALN